MARIELPEKGWVPSAVWEIYTGAENRVGYIPNTLKATSHSIRSMKAVDQFLQAFEEQGTLEPELRILASFAAAHRNENAYGMQSMRSTARRYFISESKLDAIEQDELDSLHLDDKERAVIRFARAMTDRADAGEEQLESVRQFLSEERVVELSFIVAGRNFLDRLQCTFDVDLEPELAAQRN